MCPFKKIFVDALLGQNPRTQKEVLIDPVGI
jgi:hypothetical protein